MALWLGMTLVLPAQESPYVGFVYPAGGQQGTTFRVRLGGQNLDEISGVLVTGTGVTARVTDNYRRLNMEELQLLDEQLHVLRRETMSAAARAMLQQMESTNTMSDISPPVAPPTNDNSSAETQNAAVRELISNIEKRTLEYVLAPACPAIASLALVEVTIAPDAEPGAREIRLVTWRGVSNPLPFHVGQVPEYAKKPMVTATQQVLGKESQALRRRLPGEEDERIALPCTVNGQIASGEVNRYRFTAVRGQRLVITTLGRQLVPFIADAVPGWFQPVLALYDAQGKEVACQDAYPFQPDPTVAYEVPTDGEYSFTIRDSLYRGREDFVYRITIGELPFITSLFPLGGPVGASAKPELKGWNLQGAELIPLPTGAGPGIHSFAVARKQFLSNRIPYALSQLPDSFEQEPNNTLTNAQKVTLPVMINGRINQPDDWDLFQFWGKSNDLVVAEVLARRLDSPLDAVLKLSDAAGNLLALNDDHEDLGAGINTHHADSYLFVRLPADGPYFVHLGDTARQGGEDYGYRLRLSAPEPDFELRVVPSSLGLRSRSSGTLTVYALRKDGFSAPIDLGLQNPPPGFSAAPVTLAGTQTVARITIQTDLGATSQPVGLSLCGRARIGGQEVARQAVPAEDRMQAFLWRQLVPAQELKVLVFDPAYEPPPKRVARARPPRVAVPAVPVSTNTLAGTNTAAARPTFTKEQVAGRLKELRFLFDQGVLTDAFYNEKVAECEAAQ